MKKLLVLLTALMLTLSLAACGSEEAEAVELDFMVNFQAQEAITIAFEEVIEEFEAENPGITINLIPGNSDYEQIMKTKMGSNDLPDMWSTHGWSVGRYSEYLRPLTDQDWVDDINPLIKPVITDSNGDVFILPVDVDLGGLVYNGDVLADAGVNIDDVQTWDDFFAACDQVKAAGYTPIHIGGKDHWPVGNFFDWAAPSFLITDEDDNYREELKDGSFDWTLWEPVAQLMKRLADDEYLNVDVLSSTYDDSAKNLAQDKVAFAFYGNYVIQSALMYNENANLGFMPVPSNSESDEATLISGERTTVGIWKDTEHEAEALLFLEFLTQPAVMSKLASANGVPAGLTGVSSDTGILVDDFARYADYRGFPYFDREYLPSGMWDTMCVTGTGLLTGDMTIEQAAEQMESDYNRLR